MTTQQAWRLIGSTVVLATCVVSYVGILLSPEFGFLIVGTLLISIIIATRGFKRISRFRRWFLYSVDANGNSPNITAISEIDWENFKRWAESFKSARQRGEKPNLTKTTIVAAIDLTANSFHLIPIILLFSVFSSGWPHWLISLITRYLITPAWEFAFISACYGSAASGRPTTAIIMSAWMLTAYLYRVVRFFTPSMLGDNPYKPWILFSEQTPSLASALHNGLTLIICFAAIHYECSYLNIHAYNEKLSALDSIYFSVVTATTVGYGDILPKSNTAKLITAAEMLTGFVYGTIILSTILGLWQQNELFQLNGIPPRATKQAKQPNSETISNNDDTELTPYDFI